MFDKEPYYAEKIEAYLREELSADEKATFEKLLQQDPLLYNEFVLQRDIVASIQAHRKAELKQRLQNINVGRTSNGFDPALTGVWLTGMVALGVAVWFTVQHLPAVLSHPQVSDKQPNPPTAKLEEAVRDTAASQLQPRPDRQAVEPIKEKPAPVATRDSKTVVSKAKKKQPVRVNARPEEETIPPALGNNHVNSQPKSEEAAPRTRDESPTGSQAIPADHNLSNRLNVNILDSQLKLHYYYRNGQLMTLGFDQPYTIVEIQSSNTTYMYYDGNFYELNHQQTRPTSITGGQVTAPELIESLTQKLQSRH